jgi:L-iditol 2-dehydrogenase
MFVRLATLRGARVICCDLGAGRLAVARELGAAETVLVTPDLDQVQAVLDLTPEGRGADVAIEAVGLPAVWEMTVRMVRKGGTVNLFGGSRSDTSFSIDTGRLHYGELTVKGVYHHTPAFVETAFRLLCDGSVPTAPFITAERPLGEVIDALEAMSRQEGIKYAIVP